MAKTTKSTDEIIIDIHETLIQASGEFIESIANQVLSRKVKHIGDSLYEVVE